MAEAMRPGRSFAGRAECTLLLSISQPRLMGGTPHSPLEFTVVMDETTTSPASSRASDETLLSHAEQARTRRRLEYGIHDHGVGAAPIRCLIVDDDDHFRRVVGDLLGGAGIAIVGVASTGSEALRLHDELRPDVTLVDIVLGEENGFELAEQLAVATYTEPTTVILMSASFDGDDVMDMIAGVGAAAFLPKLDISGTAVREIHRCHRSGSHSWPRLVAQSSAGRRSVTSVGADA